MSSPITILNLGAGVQSTTVALMAVHGELPPIDHAIFADTQWEPAAVYAHLGWLTGIMQSAGFRVHRITAGNIREDMIRMGRGQRWAAPPVFTRLRGRTGRLRRQCTKEYKIEPIEKKIRTILGLKPRQHWPREHRVDQWFGISLDEIERMRLSSRPAIRNVYPLIDIVRMSRGDCVTWLERQGYGVPPKSACLGCPYHTDRMWRELRDRDPAA
jgi:hypothetical protein